MLLAFSCYEVCMNARATYVHDRGKIIVAGLDFETRSVLRGRIHGRWLILVDTQGNHCRARLYAKANIDCERRVGIRRW